MGLDDSIAGVISARLNNPISKALKEIGFGKLLKESNISKQPTEKTPTHACSSKQPPHPKKGSKGSNTPYQVILHLLVMLLANKRLSTFLDQSKESFTKDVYYRLLKESRYNWRKLLLLSALRLIQKIQPLGSPLDTRVLIIDDTVEEKRGKKIEGSCDRLFSNGKKKYVRGLNILSLNYSDPYSSFILDFAIAFNDHLRILPEAFTQKVHHATHACKRRMEGLEGKLTLAFTMVKRALREGVVADYLLCDSWYAKPVFLNKIKELGLDVVTRLPLNDSIWHFKGKQKTLTRCYESITRSRKHGRYGKIRYTYCSAVLQHGVLERVKVLFIETLNTKERKLIPILSTDTTLSDEAMIDLYKKRWNIGVPSKGHILLSVKVRPKPKGSRFVAWEAPWREIETVEPSDKLLERSKMQILRLQRNVNADVASLHAVPVAETVDNARRQQTRGETGMKRTCPPAGYQRRHEWKEYMSTWELLGVWRRNTVKEALAITVSGKCQSRHQEGGLDGSTSEGYATQHTLREASRPINNFDFQSEVKAG